MYTHALTGTLTFHPISAHFFTDSIYDSISENKSTEYLSLMAAFPSSPVKSGKDAKKVPI